MKLLITEKMIAIVGSAVVVAITIAIIVAMILDPLIGIGAQGLKVIMIWAEELQLLINARDLILVKLIHFKDVENRYGSK